MMKTRPNRRGHMNVRVLLCILLTGASLDAVALEKPGITYQVFQFPADRIPRVDGSIEDWAIVPMSYAIGADQLSATPDAEGRVRERSIDATVRVGWV